MRKYYWPWWNYKGSNRKLKLERHKRDACASGGTEIIDVFANDSTKEFIEFEIRNGASFFIENNGKILTSETKIRIYREDIYKSISSGDGENIIDTIQIFKKW